AAADVGIAVSGASDITADAADVIFLPNSLETLPLFFETSRRAVQTAWQNIILFAGVLNATAVIFSATGKLGPVAAAVTHQLSSFFVMANSLRLLWSGEIGIASFGNAWERVLGNKYVDRLKGCLYGCAQRLEFGSLAGYFIENWPSIRSPFLVA